MTSGPKGCEGSLSSLQCSLCGRKVEELFEILGKPGRCCLDCSADLTAEGILTAEIDSGTLDGRNVGDLVNEWEDLAARILQRSQSAELGAY
jgi:hypothetical protein